MSKKICRICGYTETIEDNPLIGGIATECQNKEICKLRAKIRLACESSLKPFLKHTIQRTLTESKLISGLESILEVITYGVEKFE